MQSQDKIVEEFKQFDIIITTADESNIIDHHFASLSQCEGASNFRQKILQGWKILQTSLPDSIFVRGYESRVDLLRAVIIGAQGTPYHDGLFFFDIQFPLDYPNEPPQVYYHSFGLTLNPNLYSSGTVCLSLLNTWAGERMEQWNPSQSSILQVLVSIQGLVLNAKPYFNDPFLVLVPSWWGNSENKSLAYNEQTFLMNCKMMLKVLDNAPSHFEAFAAQHFRDRAETILNACRAYVNGQAKIGDRTEEAGFSSFPGANAVSKKFKLAMGLLYSRLLEAFTKNGSNLENFVEHCEEAYVQDDIHCCKYSQKGRFQSVINRKHVFSTKAFRKLKKLLGMNIAEDPDKRKTL